MALLRNLRHHVDMTNSSHTRSSQTGSTFRRAGDDRIFAGVAGGLGEHFGVNAWWFRWAFIFLAFFGGAGVLVYVIAWLVIPGPGEDEPIAANWIDGVDWSNGGTIFGVALLGVAGILFATQFFHVSGVLILAGLMFVVGLLLYRGDLRVPTRPTTPDRAGSGGETIDTQATVVAPDDGEATTAKTDGSAASAVGVIDGDQTGEPPPGKDDPPPPPVRQRPPKPPRQRSILGRLTIAVAIIVVASMALVDLSDVAVDIEPFHYFAAIVAVLGTGLLIGAWVGRARWLIIIGLLVIPMLWISMLIPTSWDFSAGEIRHTPLTVQDVDGPYEQGLGQMTIDLTGLSSAELAEIGTIEASLGVGEMVVHVPVDVGVVVRAEVTAGEVSGPFDTVSGLGVDVTKEFGPEPTVLVLDLEVGAGAINITGPRALESSSEIIIEWSNT